ncbi:MAG: hypothetical protein AB7F09_17170 [Parvibaculaceae bacterium]
MSTKSGDPPAPSGRPPTGKAGPARLGLTKIIGGTVGLAILTVLGTYIFGGFTGLTAGGVMALILGVTLSYALGVGLMVAVFYSSRFYDDDAHQAALDHFTDRQKDL